MLLLLFSSQAGALAAPVAIDTGAGSGGQRKPEQWTYVARPVFYKKVYTVEDGKPKIEEEELPAFVAQQLEREKDLSATIAVATARLEQIISDLEAIRQAERIEDARKRKRALRLAARDEKAALEQYRIQAEIIAQAYREVWAREEENAVVALLMFA